MMCSNVSSNPALGGDLIEMQIAVQWEEFGCEDDTNNSNNSEEVTKLDGK